MGRDERWSWTRIDVGMHRWFWHRKRGYLDRRHVAPTSFVVWPIEAGTTLKLLQRSEARIETLTYRV